MGDRPRGLIPSMDPLDLLLIAFVGLVAGAINTVAGGGTLITLPVMIVLGLPPHVANGTNRIGVVVQSAVASWQFHKEKALDLRLAVRLILPACIGAILGANLSLDLDEAVFKKLVAVLMILVLTVMLVRELPTFKRRRAERDEDARPTPLWIQISVFAAIGFYGGFLQAGVGFFLLAGLNLVSDLDLVKANAIKVMLVFAYTALAIPVFVWHGQIDWLAGGALAAGSMLGGWLGTKMTVSWGPLFVRIILLFVVLASSTHLLGLW